MTSSNIIIRDQAFEAVLINPLMAYSICVAALLVVCWFAKE